jgi:hypothetical protein
MSECLVLFVAFPYYCLNLPWAKICVVR